MIPLNEWQTGNIDFVPHGGKGVYSYRDYTGGWIVQVMGMCDKGAFTVVVSACNTQFDGLYMEMMPQHNDTIRVTFNYEGGREKDEKSMMVQAATVAAQDIDELSREMKQAASVAARYALDVREDLTDEDRASLEELCK